MRHLLLLLGISLLGVSDTYGAGGCRQQEDFEADLEETFPTPIWSYSGQNGPRNWGNLRPDFIPCSIGKKQSPIAIDGSSEANLAEIQFQYQATRIHLVNRENTIQINYAPGSEIHLGDKIYPLTQIRFHAPSEHVILGKRYPMEIHLIHQSPSGEYAILAIPVKEGAENLKLAAFWKMLPEFPGHTRNLDHLYINALNLLPEKKNYYFYEGSLTSPPCSEGVKWHVFQEPISLSKLQIERFQLLYPDNARPAQPKNGRFILKN